MGLIQREIERAGIPTVGISIVRELSEKVRPPRTLFTGLPLGHSLGWPGDAAGQRRVLRHALELLERLRQAGTIVDLPGRPQEPRQACTAVSEIDLTAPCGRQKKPSVA